MSSYQRLLAKTASAPSFDAEAASVAYDNWMSGQDPDYQSRYSAADLNSHFENEFLPVYLAEKTAEDEQVQAKFAEAEVLGDIIGQRAAEHIRYELEKSASVKGGRGPGVNLHKDPGTLRGMADELGGPRARDAAIKAERFIGRHARGAVDRAGAYIRGIPGRAYGAAKDAVRRGADRAWQGAKNNKGKLALIGAGAGGLAYLHHRKNSSDEGFDNDVALQIEEYASVIESGGAIDLSIPARDQYDLDVKETALQVMQADGIIDIE